VLSTVESDGVGRPEFPNVVDLRAGCVPKMVVYSDALPEGPGTGVTTEAVVAGADEMGTASVLELEATPELAGPEGQLYPVEADAVGNDT
jgi:hypothetical protein